MSKARSILPWLIPPALAIIAFAPVLGMWFVADDFGHLLYNERLPFPQPLLAFGGDALFYRPLSTALTWNLGTTLFGTNAFPYHAISLLVHALSAFLLSRLGYVVSGSMPAGLLAGSLFAVYPLTTEPVAWLAAQWDVLGAACVLGAALGFAVAWRNSLQGKPARLPYALGLLSAFLAVGMKESTLPLPAVLPFVALAITTKDEGRRTKDGEWEMVESGDLEDKSSFVLRPSSFVPKALAWSLPYALPTLLFVGLRLVSDATIGGYRNAPTDFQRFFWDALVTAFLGMLMPLNRPVFGDTLAQVTGMTMTILVLGALILWGRRRWPVLLLALVWWVAFLVPALNLIMLADRAANLQNRIYYLSLIGFCLALGTLLSVPLAWSRRRVQVGWAGVALALLIAVPITWKQLEPWTQASRQTRHIVSELGSMLPPKQKGRIEINAHNLPLEYEGAYVFWNGLDTAVQVFHGQSARVNGVDKLNSQALAESLGNDIGRWNLDFTFNPADELFYVGGLAGVTKAAEPPATPGTLAWDFRACAEGSPDGAQVTNADLECREGYTTMSARDSDPTITFSGLDQDLTGVRWLRLAASMRHASLDAPRLGEWYWSGEDGAWSEQKSARFYVGTDKEWRVYWTYVSAADVGTRLTNLRFDPVNDRAEAELGWIAVTAIGGVK